MGLILCESCGLITNRDAAPLQGLKLSNRRLDCSVTYDGVYIVSQRFIDVFSSKSLQGLDFEPLPDDSPFFTLRPQRVVQMDAKRSRTRFGPHCPDCGQFSEVTGVTPFFLTAETVVEDHEFARTDLEFGSYDSKSFAVVCGGHAMEVLSRNGLRGVFFERIDG